MDKSSDYVVESPTYVILSPDYKVNSSPQPLRHKTRLDKIRKLRSILGYFPILGNLRKVKEIEKGLRNSKEMFVTLKVIYFFGERS